MPKNIFLNSFRLADLVQREFEKSGRINRGVKQRNEKGIWVLHATGMPSILIETGFISNKEEEEYLNSERGQDEIVEDITNALKDYMVLLQNQKTPAGSYFPADTGKDAMAFLQAIEEKEKKWNSN